MASPDVVLRGRRSGLGLAAGLLCGLLAAGGCGAQATSAEDRFDALWQTFDERYALFGVKPVDWAALRERYRPRAAGANGDVALAALVHAMMAELRDPHLWLKEPGGVIDGTYRPPSAANFDPAAWSAWTAARGAVQGPHWGHLTLGAVPYVWVDSWTSALPTDDIGAWFESIRDAPALVFDVRMNGGGIDELSRGVAARFTDREVTAFRFRTRTGPRHEDLSTPVDVRVAPGGPWQFTRPVLVLAGRGSGSATEEFVAAMRELPHVTVAGEPTMGATGNPEWHDLGGGWSYTVSIWRCATADGLEIEDQGIPPDVAVAATPADFAAGRDPVLEYAERWAAAQQP